MAWAADTRTVSAATAHPFLREGIWEKRHSTSGQEVVGPADVIMLRHALCLLPATTLPLVLGVLEHKLDRGIPVVTSC